MRCTNPPPNESLPNVRPCLWIVVREGRALVVVANKADLVDVGRKEYGEGVRKQLEQLAPQVKPTHPLKPTPLFYHQYMQRLQTASGSLD